MSLLITSRTVFMQTANLLAWFIALFVLPAAAQTAPSNSPPKPTSAEGPLRVHTENPRYFTDGRGKAIYLGGHQVFTEIQDNAWTKPWVLDWPKHLEFMKERNLNYLRNWIIFSTGGDPKNPASPMPYARTGPGTATDGGPKFDLRKFDETYFQRLHDRIRLAQDQGIAVSIMLFEVYGFNANVKDKALWDTNIFNGKNNVNGIDADLNGDSIGLEFFYADDPALRQIQRDYVKKVIDSVNDLDNVIFEVANECGATQWQHEMIDFIHEYEGKNKPQRHLVLMSPGGDDVHGRWINQSKRDLTGSHADVIAVMNAWADYKQDPPANEESLPAIMDMDHISPSGSDDHILPWKAFTRGYHYSIYDHPFENRRNEGPSWELARRNVGAAVSYSRRFSDLAAADPHGELSSTKYCLAHPGHDYLILQPATDVSFTVNVQPAQYRYEWFRPETAKVEKTGSFQTAGGVEEFKAPFVGPAVLYLAASSAGSEQRQPIRDIAKPPIGFPGKDWADASPESQGMDPAKLKVAVDHLGRTIAPPEPCRVPKPLRQGEFLSPQSVSALAISPDGRQLAVTTMAFRHDRNFWLLADDGRVLWGRYLEPWAPGQIAFLPHGKRFAVGLAYSRFTDPNPTLALFDGESDAPIYGCDDAWELGWMRYGAGDWRTGWMASPLADMLTATEGGLFTTPFHLDDKATEKPGQWCRRPNLGKRAWRMAASADGRILVCGYFVADNSKSQVQGVASLESPGITLAAIDGTTGMVRWKAKPISPPSDVPLPPEPTDEFRPLADDFHMTPFAMVPFQAAISVAASRDAGRVACTEYAGYGRIGQERIHPNWSPRHPLWLCPRQQGTLRVFGAEGEELTRAALPEPGLFEVHLSPDGSLAWCVPMSWFARGLAGCPWLPADDKANRVFVFELARQQWSMSWQFPDAVSDFAVHPQGQAALASCWNGRLYLVRYDGSVQAMIEAGSPARLRWSADGRFAIAGTQQGEIWRVEADGTTAWHVSIPVRQVPPMAQPLKPVFDGIPIYRVGRVGPEHAYVGDIWLIKTPQGGILVDSGGTSAVSLTLERIKAAGVEPRQIHYLLLSHTHGDHVGGAYLWRSLGAKVVAPAPAAFPATWMVPTLNHYGIWVPCAIDQPLPLARPGDTTHFTLDSLNIEAIFAPGHSFDTVVYVLNLAGRRVFLTGDIGFQGNNNILNRCWGDMPKARRVMEILREHILPLRPEIVFTGHDEHSNGVEYWQDILRATEEAIRKAETLRNQ